MSQINLTQGTQLLEGCNQRLKHQQSTVRSPWGDTITSLEK